MKFYFFALGVSGIGISGGDRIFTEFAQRWGRNYPLKIYTSYEGARLCKKINITALNLEILEIKNKNLEKVFLLNYLYKIIEGIKLGFSLHLKNNRDTILYSASDFWMDTLPCFILKLRYSKIQWAASWYQTAPNPFIGYAEGQRDEKYRFRAFLYWLSQLPIKPLISKFADFVLVNNEEERKQFPQLNTKKKVIVVLGAVDLTKIEKWKMSCKAGSGFAKKTGNLSKVYDAVFQGRFHPQKGVVELIDIWKKVVDKRPDAKLAMIGDGPLMESVKLKVKSEKLEKNVKLFGYVFDGDEKYKIFAQSKLVVHPAFYDSGGMAAAEAMAFGLPCIGFDLPSYKSYYPEGMIRVKIGDLTAFSQEIIKYLNDEKKITKDGAKARDFIRKRFSWEVRAKEVRNKIIWE